MNRIRHFKLLPALVVLAAPLVPSAAAERGTVEKFERALPIISKRDDASRDVRFFADGREYRLRLRLNSRLERWSSGHWHQYAGFLEGREHSWARLAMTDATLRGVIFDGSELIAIEPAENGEVTVYRVPDLRFTPPLSFEQDTLADPARKSSAAAPSTPRSEAVTVRRKLEVSVIGDATFRARYESDADAKDAMLTRLNIVDGIFSSEVGAAIEVASMSLAADLGNPLDDSTDPATLLDSLGRLRQQTPLLNSRGLTHLFTGRNLDGDNVGIAYESSLCSARLSASLAQAHSSATLDALISAHEIGHVFGAPHDGSGQCAAVPQGQFIMSPVLNSQATTFSQCSLDQMAPLVASARCLAAVSPPDVAMPASLGAHDAIVNTDFDWSLELTNEGDSAATDAHVTIEITPAIEFVSASAEKGSCDFQHSQAACDLASLGAGASATLSFVVRSATAGTFAAHAEVATPGDSSPSNDASDGTLRVQSAGTPPITAPPEQPAKGGGGAIDMFLLGILGALLGGAARRRFSPRAAAH
jgi:hypothetical protein